MTNLDFLASVWNQIPSTFQNEFESTSVYKSVRKAVVKREELIGITIRPTDDCSFDLLVPERFRPWWLDYDPGEPRSCHEPPTTRTLIEETDEGDVVWDMGSQFGYFTFLAAACNRSPENIHVFELSPYKSIRIGRVMKKVFGDATPSVINAKLGDGNDGSLSGDQYRRRTESPDVIKMDIEGAEALVVPSTAETIREHHPTLVVEVHPNKIRQHFDSSESDIFDLVVEEYDDIRVCHEFRSQGGTWEEVSDLESFVASRSDEQVTLHGGLDPDSYQLRCI